MRFSDTLFIEHSFNRTVLQSNIRPILNSKNTHTGFFQYFCLLKLGYCAFCTNLPIGTNKSV